VLLICRAITAVRRRQHLLIDYSAMSSRIRAAVFDLRAMCGIEGRPASDAHE